MKIFKYNSLAKEIMNEGHEIGNHTLKHQKITKLNSSEIHSSINLVQKYALEKFDYKIKYFRPPHGRFDFRTKNS